MWQPLNGEPALPAWGIVPQPDEPAHRFFARLTALNGQDSARSLAHQMGLNGRRASGLLEFCLALPIREKERLRASTASVAGSRVTLCGQTFAKFDWSVHMARVCPACLSESEHARNWWDLKVVFRCPFHDEPLIRESKGSVTRWWTKSPARFADGNPIREGGLVRGSSKTDASWEAYVLGRMSVGATVPIALLDDVASMADVVKAVEHVGRASIAGYSDRRPTLRAVGAAREEIIRTGFAALSEGYGALRCIAARVADASPTAQSGSEQWGARKLFGWLGRSYESGHPIVPEFERALRDEAHARSIYQGWLKLDAYKPANTPFTMVELARLVSLTPRMTRKLATELGLGDPSSNKRRRHLFTSAAVDQIKNFKESLLDRDGASRLMKIDRGHFDALVHEKRIVPICRFTDGGSTSDRFDPSHLADVEQRLCAASGDDWRQRRVPIRGKGVKWRPEIRADRMPTVIKRFRGMSDADGLPISGAASVLCVDLVTTRKLLDHGILMQTEATSTRPRVSRDSVHRASKKYAPARIYANSFNDSRSRKRFVEALAAVGVPSLALGPGATALVERAVARKALNLSHDPDQVSDPKSGFWKAAEEAVRSNRLPFRSTQPMPRSSLVVWDSSRLIRVVFSFADGDCAVVGGVASGSCATRRGVILPYVAKNLRSGATSSLHAYELDENGLVAASQKFNLHDEGSWAVGLGFIANYLTNVMHALYDARAAQREIKKSAA